MNDRIHHIDSLRGLAALVVAFVFHQHYLTGQMGSGPLDGLPGFTWLHDKGWVMVDLFFVISGFVFSRIYLGEGRIGDGGVAFAQARFARLYPLHLATLLGAAAIFALGTPFSVTYAHNDLSNFVLNLLMLQEGGLQSGKSFNLPSWSISVEVFCYFAFFALATFVRKGFHLIAVGITVLAIIATVSDNSTVDHVARGFCGFFAGVIVERARQRRFATIALLAAIPLVVAIAGGDGMNLGAILSMSVFPTLIVLGRYIPGITHPVLTWLGDRSYSIYLIHAPVYMAMNVLIFGGSRVPMPLVWPSILVGWLTILALSDFSYRRFEVPMRRWISGWQLGRKRFSPSIGDSSTA